MAFDQNKYNKQYSKTKKGLLINSYHKQVKRSIKLGFTEIGYSFEELYKWAMSQHLFHDLYDLWVLSEFDTWQRPSVDRKDDYENYKISNIQLTTRRKNINRGHEDMKNGINNKQNVSVIATMHSGVELEYKSISIASKASGAKIGNITKCCQGKRKTAGGYSWKYK